MTECWTWTHTVLVIPILRKTALQSPRGPAFMWNREYSVAHVHAEEKTVQMSRFWTGRTAPTFTWPTTFSRSYWCIREIKAQKTSFQKCGRISMDPPWTWNVPVWMNRNFHGRTLYWYLPLGNLLISIGELHLYCVCLSHSHHGPQRTKHKKPRMKTAETEEYMWIIDSREEAARREANRR